MKWHRSWAIILRHIYLFPRSFDRITDSFFWPILDVVLWGLTATWIGKVAAAESTVILSILTACIFWRVFWMSNYEVGVNLLEECWNRNLTNLIASPISKLEWLTATLAVGIGKLMITVGLMATSIWIFYSLNVFELGWLWIPYVMSLTIFGWVIGFLASSLVLYWGIRAQALAWTLAFILAPISAVYYPLELLPSWAQVIALSLPSTYIFEGIRGMILRGDSGLILLAKSFLLNLAYLALTLYIFNYAFERTRMKGFDHLE